MFSKIGGKPPKWIVKIMENPIKMDDLGGKPTIFGNTHINSIIHLSDDSQKFDQSLRKAGERLRFKKVSGAIWAWQLSVGNGKEQLDD